MNSINLESISIAAISLRRIQMEQVNETKRIIEINGVKMEVDLRTAKQVYDNLHIGSRVKVLDKEYSETKIHHGIIVAFDNFPSFPTITVLAVKNNWNTPELKFFYINAESKSELVPATDWLPDLDKARCEELMAAKIAEAQNKLDELKSMQKFFIEKFAQTLTTKGE
jgi:hypothetical protein